MRLRFTFCLKDWGTNRAGVGPRRKLIEGMTSHLVSYSLNQLWFSFPGLKEIGTV